MDPVEYTFTPPETVDGETYTTITFGPMKVKHRLAGDGHNNPEEGQLAVFAAMADVPVDLIKEIPEADFDDLRPKLEALMGKRGAALKRLREAAEEKMDQLEEALQSDPKAAIELMKSMGQMGNATDDPDGKAGETASSSSPNTQEPRST